MVNYPNRDNMTGETWVQLKDAKGGVVYAPAFDVKLIKDALVFYVDHNGSISDYEKRQAVNLLHRLNNPT